MVVEFGEVWMMLNIVEGLVVAEIALVFPDVDCASISTVFDVSSCATYQRCRNRQSLFSRIQPS